MKRVMFVLSCAVMALCARGDMIVFSDFGPGGIYSQNFSAGVPASSPFEEVAAQFTVGASGTFPRSTSA
jgi:hypothetical protein